MNHMLNHADFNMRKKEVSREEWIADAVKVFKQRIEQIKQQNNETNANHKQMKYEELKQLPPDTIIKVRMNYTYNVQDVTPEIWQFFLNMNADIEHTFLNDKKTIKQENEA